MIEFDPIQHGTGVEVVDAQHKRLFEMVNVLLDGRKRDPKEVRELLTFLGDYVVTHFREEEELMAGRKCKVAELNKEEHQRFLGDYTKFLTRFDQVGLTPEFTSDIRRELVEWLVNHIVKVDRALLETKPSAAELKNLTPVADRVEAGKPKGFWARLFGR
jgi:hemerythrin